MISFLNWHGMSDCIFSFKFSFRFGHSEKATKFEKNLPLKIWPYSVMSKFKWRIFFKFCGLLRISELYFNMLLLKMSWQQVFSILITAVKKCVNTASLYYWDVIKDQQDSCKKVLNTEKDNDSNKSCNKSSNTCFDNLFNTYFMLHLCQKDR